MRRRTLLLSTIVGLATIAIVAWGVRGLHPSRLTSRDSASALFSRAATFLVPAADLPVDARPRFRAGQALARQPWVKAPSSTDARDGLGPLYDARSCLACHFKGGRGIVPPDDGRLATGTVVRLSILGSALRGGPLPEPTYGHQLQRKTIDASAALGGRNVRLPAEGTAHVEWETKPFVYPDGRTVALRRPRLKIQRLGYGPLNERLQTSLRHAPPLYGLGLIDLIAAESILARADPNDADGDGISGRPNFVWSRQTQAKTLGRYGWKANQPTLRHQVTAALVGDIGITSDLYPDETCTEPQTACLTAPRGSEPDGVEISADLVELIADFNRSLAVPARRKPEHPMVKAGQRHFAAMGCASCHTPSHRTATTQRWPHLSDRQFSPYTDLLLHDMGEGLADGRPDFEATGNEWRTAPLWGVGLSRTVHEHAGLLHDGRARSVEEAILWHGGESAKSRTAFTHADADARRELLAFRPVDLRFRASRHSALTTVVGQSQSMPLSSIRCSYRASVRVRRKHTIASTSKSVMG